MQFPNKMAQIIFPTTATGRNLRWISKVALTASGKEMPAMSPVTVKRMEWPGTCTIFER